MKKTTMIQKFIWWTYLILLFAVIGVKFNGSFTELCDKMVSTSFGTNYNIVPFKTIDLHIRYYSRSWAKLNLWGNLIPFVPYGFLLPIVYPKMNRFANVFLCGLVFVLFIEVFQFFTRLGTFDVDDIMLNMVGICFGYLLFQAGNFVCKQKKK